MGTKSTSGDASAANQTTIIGHIDGIETLLTAIQTAVEIIDNFISGARGLVTEDNSAAALTALQTIDNFISGARGLVTEDNSAAIAASLAIMDDWDETNRAAVNLIASQAGIAGGAGAVGASTPRVTLASDDRAVAALEGSLSGPGSPSIDSFTSTGINVGAGANSQIIAAPGASKQIWIFGFVGTANVAGTVSIQDEDDTALSGVMPVAANGGFVISPSGNFAMPWIKVATNKAVELDCVTCTFDGVVSYAIVSV